jgi:hypothetical protein
MLLMLQVGSNSPHPFSNLKPETRSALNIDAQVSNNMKLRLNNRRPWQQ